MKRCPLGNDAFPNPPVNAGTRDIPLALDNTIVTS